MPMIFWSGIFAEVENFCRWEGVEKKAPAQKTKRPTEMKERRNHFPLHS